MGGSLLLICKQNIKMIAIVDVLIQNYYHRTIKPSVALAAIKHSDSIDQLLFYHKFAVIFQAVTFLWVIALSRNQHL